MAPPDVDLCWALPHPPGPTVHSARCFRRLGSIVLFALLLAARSRATTTLFFVSQDGTTLFATTGTSVSTVANGSSSLPFHPDPLLGNTMSATIAGSIMYFTASDTTGATSALWAYDGVHATQITSASNYVNTNQDDNNPANPGTVATFNGDVVFSQTSVSNNDSGGYDLATFAIYNPSSRTISQPSVPNGGADPQDFVVLGSTLYFEAYDTTAQQEAIYSYDGTTVLEQYNSSTRAATGPLIAYNGHLYYGSGSSSLVELTPSASELGATSSTVTTTDTDNPTLSATSVIVANNLLYFLGPANGGVWSINTSNSSTQVFASIGAQDFTPAAYNGELYFISYAVSGTNLVPNLYTTTGTSPSELSANFYASNFVVSGSTLYFENTNSGANLGTINGTTIGSLAVPGGVQGVPIISAPFAYTSYTAGTVSSPPTLTAGATATFAGGGSPVTLDSSLVVAAGTSSNLVSATIAIGSPVTGDTLNFTNQNGITGSYDSATGTLTLSGTASVGAYQTALESVTYSFNPSNGDPTGGGSHTSRTLSWAASDGTLTSSAVTSTLDVTHTAPTVTAGATVSYQEGDAAVVLDSALTAADVDSGGNLTGATVTISDFHSGDTLSFTNQSGIAGSYDAADGVLSLSGTATVADYQAALRSIAFSTDSASFAARTIEWSVADGVDGSAATTSTVDIEIAPVVTAGATATFTGGGSAVVPDAALAITAGSDSNLAEATVAITGFVAGDRLNFVNQNGITGSYDTTNGVLTLTGTATVADYQAALESVTYSFTPSNGDPTLGGADMTRTIDWTVNDGTASSNTAVSTLHVSHAAPTVTAGGTAVFVVDGSPVSLDGTITLSDADSGGTLAGATIMIGAGFLAGDTLNFTNQNGITGSYNGTTGVLTLAGTASIANYQSALDSITYSSAASNPTSSGSDSSRTIDWTVTDGVDSSSSAASTVDFDIAPNVTAGATANFTGGGSAVPLDGALSIAAGSSSTLAGATISITAGWRAGDTLDFTNQNGISGSYDSATGVLTLTGTASVAHYEAALESITYGFTPADDDPTAGNTDDSRTVTWTVTDGTASSPGVTSTVALAHAAPVANAGATATFVFGGTPAALDASLTVADADSGGALVGATITLSSGFLAGDTLNFTSQNGITGSYNGATGVLTLSGAASIADYQAALESITFSSSAADPTAGGTDMTRTAEWIVNDGTSASTAVTSAVSIAPDILSVTAPAGGNYGQNQTLSFTVTFSDPVVVTGAPTLGVTVGTATRTAAYASGSGTNTLVFTYTIQAGDTGAVAVVSPVLLNGGTILAAGDGAAAALAFTPPSTSSLRVLLAPTLAWVRPAPLIFGTTLSPAQLDATANVPGTFAYTYPIGTEFTVGQYAVNATFTPSDPTTYLSGTVGTLITVVPATPVITWAVPAPIPAGAALTGSQLDAVANVAGTFTYSPAAGSVLAAGTQTLTATFTPADRVDYSGATASVAVSVVPFAPPPTQTTTGGPVTLPSTIGGVPATYTVVSGPATINGTTLTPTGTPGVVTVQVTLQPAGGGPSSTTTFTLDVQAPASAVNVSALGTVPPNQSLILGFYVSGAGQKTVLLRGVGPTLGTFGVPDPLEQPVMMLFSSNGTLLVTNDGWGGSSQLASLFATVGAFSLPAGSGDCAATATLSSGAYTLIVAGAAGTSGAALAELYDTTPSPLLASQQIVNVSARGVVSPATPLTVGFVIAGTQPEQILIRGDGPALAAFGVAGVLATPRLSIFNSGGALIAQNAGWGTQVTAPGSAYTPASAAAVAAAAAQAGAFPLATDSADAAVLVTLPPGQYTAQVAGGSGAALAEVYTAP